MRAASQGCRKLVNHNEEEVIERRERSKGGEKREGRERDGERKRGPERERGEKERSHSLNL